MWPAPWVRLLTLDGATSALLGKEKQSLLLNHCNTPHPTLFCPDWDSEGLYTQGRKEELRGYAWSGKRGREELEGQWPKGEGGRRMVLEKSSFNKNQN